MNSKILLPIYDLLNNGIKIWAQNEKVQLFVLNNAVLSEDQKNFIRSNKDNILSLLKENQIYSRENNILILKNNSQK